jgi:hypothetical protein
MAQGAEAGESFAIPEAMGKLTFNDVDDAQLKRSARS